MLPRGLDHHLARPGAVVALLRRAGEAVLDLALPGECAVCAAPGEACCAACLARLCKSVRVHPRHPTVAPAGGPPVWSACPYDDVAAGLLVAYKDGGRRDLARLLAPLLADSLTAAARWADWPHRSSPIVVTVPSARAAVWRRGDDPLDTLTRAALAGLPGEEAAPLVRGLRVRRRVDDQSTLDRVARRANVDGAFTVAPSAAAFVAGRPVLLVDDIVTTGATLVEAERALREAGALEVRAAVVAATARRRRSARCSPLVPRVD